MVIAVVFVACFRPSCSFGPYFSTVGDTIEASRNSPSMGSSSRMDLGRRMGSWTCLRCSCRPFVASWLVGSGMSGLGLGDNWRADPDRENMLNCSGSNGVAAWSGVSSAPEGNNAFRTSHNLFSPFSLAYFIWLQHRPHTRYSAYDSSDGNCFWDWGWTSLQRQECIGWRASYWFFSYVCQIRYAEYLKNVRPNSLRTLICTRCRSYFECGVWECSELVIKSTRESF